MKLDPRHLEILAAVVDSNGLTEGANSLGKSQPSVSRTLSELEKRIGLPLFKPGRRPLQPTDLGRELAEQGRQVARASQSASAILARRQGRVGAVVRIGGTPIFMEGVISGIIAEFQQRHSDVRVDASFAYADELAVGLHDGSIDLAVCPLRLDDVPAGTDFKPLIPGSNVFVCRTDHPLARQATISARDTAAYPWIAPPAGSPLYRDLRQALTEIGTADLKIGFSGGTLASVLQFLTGSDALTVLPLSVLAQDPCASRVVALPLGIAHPDRHLGLLTASGRRASRAVAQFATFVETRLAQSARALNAGAAGPQYGVATP